VKVLCIDHGAFLRSYRQRYVAMSVEPDIELMVVAPRTLNQLNYAGQSDVADTSEAGYRLEVCGFAPAKAHRGLYDPVRLLRLIRHYQPDIIHTQGEPEALSSMEVCLVRGTVASRSALVFSSWANINAYLIGWPYRIGALYTKSYEFVLRHAQAATTYNAVAEDVLRTNGFQGYVKTIPWGVDGNAFQRLTSQDLRQRLGIDGFNVGYVGRMESSKGVATLIRAISEAHVECTLLLIGEGPARAGWEGLARQLGVRTYWAGPVNSASMPAYLNCLDVLVLPSETTKYWAEQFGKVLIEAMACEVPVVGSDSGEIPSVIGDAGHVFREKNSADLGAILKRLEIDKDHRLECGHRGRSRAMRVYSWETVAKQTVAFYRDLL
jgi:glycosyltransferase involved in cell wall biosynthesis